MRKFRKFDGTPINDFIGYVNEYLEVFNDEPIEILVGTDSQTRGKETVFCTVVAFYHPGHGAHCIYTKWKTPRFRKSEMPIRLMKEVEASIEIAQEIKFHTWGEVKYIDLDINPEEDAGSNVVFQSAIGYVKGMGYAYRFKSLGPLITTLADSVVKH